jgi:nucleotide-binding universal stress UspA family protein
VPMNSPPPPPVIVGVDGSLGSHVAARYAAAEARRLATGLRLVHVVPTYWGLAPAPMMALPPIDLADTGRSILAIAEAKARAAAPDLDIEVELRQGVRQLVLAEAAADAPLLVVGRDTRPVLERLLLGNTAAGVACRAACPVVSVPADWESDTPEGVVVVGIKSATNAGALVADAFAVASARRARLLVLHAWRLPSGYDDVIADRVSVDDWNQRSTHELERLLSQSQETHPEVGVDIRVEHDYAARALQRASQQADLLVIARRAHGIPASLHLGGTARSLLRAASCPVRVVPPGAP